MDRRSLARDLGGKNSPGIADSASDFPAEAFERILHSDSSVQRHRGGPALLSCLIGRVEGASYQLLKKNAHGLVFTGSLEPRRDAFQFDGTIAQGGGLGVQSIPQRALIVCANSVLLWQHGWETLLSIGKCP